MNRRKKLLKTAAGLGTLLVLFFSVTTVLPELYRYMRIRRM